MKILKASDWLIRFSFYGLFFLVPLIFWKDTSELYELNKMWFTFGFTLLIASAWAVKTVVLKKFYLQRTPLDIPIAIFLISQIISTVFSLDPYVSFWGYYSRFNGGLLSTICYILLYYAFLSNFSLSKRGELWQIPLSGRADEATSALEMVKKLLGISLISGGIVVLWGLPSHFGYDPTCLLFRGSFDVSCWVGEFQPKIRIFSTLGQPDWLGAYLAILTPLLFGFFLNSKRRLIAFCFLLISALFYLALLYTKSRAALLGIWIAIALFCLHYLMNELNIKLNELKPKKILLKTKPLLLLLTLFALLGIWIYVPINFPKGKIQSQKTAQTTQTSARGGGTESAIIRLSGPWQGAVIAWLHNPIIGTGVETFAFAFYKYKPAGHNLTSEWNFLYNKAHNEYLNYLATTGIIGLGSYLFIIGAFFYSLRKFIKKKVDLLTLGLIAGYISILVTNFFGFSVVIVNLYFFLIPAFAFVTLGILNPKKTFLKKFGEEDGNPLSLTQKVDIFVIFIVFAYLFLFLVNFWFADQAYALGQNLRNAGQYSDAYYKLKEAVSRIPFEPTYKDELASNDSIFGVSLLSQLTSDAKDKDKIAAYANELIKESVFYAEENTRNHPNNVTFWKTKVRVYYILSQIDPKYTKDALSALEKAATIAPTDPNIFYNLGLLYGQSGNSKKAIENLEKSIKLKPNYETGYYALGLFYRELATDKNGKVIDQALNDKAIAQMQYILKYLNPKSKEAQDALDSFQK